ncbi:MAG TPA: endopeptidase La [Woeseiaceae bacterium]|nr:endopeptidase La [Woeseiaceae bacterium]
MNEPNPQANDPKTEMSDTLPIVPIRDMVLFPGVIHPVTVRRPGSIAAAQAAIRGNGKLGLLLQRSSDKENPLPDDLYWVGTVVNILRYVTGPDNAHHLICQGEMRFRATDFTETKPYMLARFDIPEEAAGKEDEIEARVRVLKQQATQAIEFMPQVPGELAESLRAIDQPGMLCDVIAGFLDIPAAEKQRLLETFDIRSRLDAVVELMARRLEVLELSHQIQEQTKASLNERQREAVLREQLRTIQQQLGEGEEANAAEFEAIDKAIKHAGMPEEVEEHARKEFKRLKQMPPQAGEYPMLRNYIDWLTELPWSKLDTESIDIGKARRILDEDHYDLEDIKKRIVEYLAVRKLNPEGRSPILCFVGPPGVGKTSLGQSIARAVGLEFVRASLGGTHDEAEIRGHRRTYIGALPGKIIQSIRKAGTRNPVFMLDEIDKLGASLHGDPSSALLEVLDPEQNSTFQDNYLGVPFDLSKVVFIATANRLDTIAPPLLDRMEVIELRGYTTEEKLQIARRYLVERQLENNGLSADQVEISDEALLSIITEYTRESGVRNLEKRIGALLRHVAVTFAEGNGEAKKLGTDDVYRILGAPRYENEVALRTGMPGVATGLAWTPVGGDILFIESTRIPGSGKLILTGKLGDVMKESAQAALSLVKNRFADVKEEAEILRTNDLHVHVPAGAIPKDGPSAGVAMFVSMASLITNQTVRHDVAMTGEISLRGLVLPVGGIKEKVIAAQRAGIRTVMLPDRNRKDYEEIPESVRSELHFVWLKNVDEALEAALARDPQRTAATAR